MSAARWRAWSGIAALAGLGALAVGAFFDPRRAAFAYLVAWSFCATLALGSLFWILIENLCAYWFVALRRIAEHALRTLPLVALSFVPVLLSLHALYPWSEPGEIADAHARALVEVKGIYLTPVFFAARSALYFAIFLGCALPLLRWSARQSAGVTPAEGERLARWQKRLSAAGLPACAFALNFAAVDWWMSLEPTWASSMFGVTVFAGSAVGGLALLGVASALLYRRAPLRGTITVSHFHALGKLLFTILVFWAYVSFFQYFIIWIANLPDEVTWYLPRARGRWAPLGVVLVVGYFALPFFALLSRELKRRPRRLAAVCVWLLAMHYLELYWIVIPAAGPRSAPHWLDLAALIGVGGAFLFYGLVRAAGESAPARSDPRYERALHFETS